MSDSIPMPKGRAYVDADGIVHMEYEPNTDMTLEDARASVDAMKMFSARAGRPLPMLVDVRTTRQLSMEARRLFASPEALAIYSALALVGGSHVANMIANVFLALRRGGGPARLFTRVDEAVEWLKKYR